MPFRLTILGSNSAIPAYGRHPTAQILNYLHHQFLIDCGEGTQMQMQKFGIKRARLDHAFISHLHGDHYFGLIGLLTSFSLNGREKPFHIICPEGIKEIIEVQIKHGYTRLKFDLVYHFIDPQHPGVVYESDLILVEGVQLDHKIPCTGFVFREKEKDRNILPQKIKEFNISVPDILKIKAGADLRLDDGRMIPNAALTREPAPLHSYAFITDTLMKRDILGHIEGVDLLYHEATFGQEMISRAVKTHHTTAMQAAELARDAGVKKLIIGHFSSRYDNLEPLLEEAIKVFPNTELALEGSSFEF